MKLIRAGWPTPRKFLLLLILTAAWIYVYILTLAQTPRSCLNVMQAITTIFFIIVFSRRSWAVTSELSAGGDEKETYGGMYLALALGACIWSFSIPDYFISDDFAHLYHARSPVLGNLWESLVQGQAGTFLRPLGFASIFLDYGLWHHWPPGYHLTNLMIHLAGAAGLYMLCRNLKFRPCTATTASVIFSVLPVNAETIAWMGARFDLLSTCLTVWMTVFYLKFRNTGLRRFYLFALVSFAFAVFSKETAYIAPFLLLSMEFLMFKSDRRLKPVSGFFCTAVVLFAYRWIVLGGIGGYSNAAGEPAAFDFGIRLLEGLFFRIPSLSLLGFNWSRPLFPAVGILASLTASLLLLIALSSKSGSIGLNRLFWGLAWVLLAVLPAHPLILIGANLTNSRILYLGSAGAAILIALLLDGIAHAQIRRTAAAVLVGLFCIAAIFNLSAWHWTSRLSRRLLIAITQIEPSPPPNTVFIFHDLPTTVRGVFYLRVGLQEAVKMTYNREDIAVLRAEDIPSQTEPGVYPGPVIRLKWEEKGDTLLQRMDADGSVLPGSNNE